MLIKYAEDVVEIFLFPYFLGQPYNLFFLHSEILFSLISFHTFLIVFFTIDCSCLLLFSGNPFFTFLMFYAVKK